MFVNKRSEMVDRWERDGQFFETYHKREECVFVDVPLSLQMPRVIVENKLSLQPKVLKTEGESSTRETNNTKDETNRKKTPPQHQKEPCCTMQ